MVPGVVICGCVLRGDRLVRGVEGGGGHPIVSSTPGAMTR
jgi:hypothetical protein